MSSVRKRERRKRVTKGAKVVGYKVPEVGAMLRVSRNTVYEMIDRGELEYTRAGRLIRILAEPFHEKFGAAIAA